MDDTIKIRGGSGKTPELQDKELGYNRDEKALYIGTPEENVRLCGADDIAGAKKYADELIEGAKKYADGLKSEAKEYADSIVNGAKEYIDGLIAEVNERLEALETPE